MEGLNASFLNYLAYLCRMKNFKNSLFLFLLISVFNLSAQFGKNAGLQDSVKNFYDIKKDFEEYWKDKEIPRGSGYKPMKRWIHLMEPRVYPSGDLRNAGPKRDYEEYQKYLQNNATAKQIITASPSATTREAHVVPVKERHAV